MPYTKLLNQLIENSKLQVKEIAEKCKKYGVDLSAAYLSILRTNEGRSASDDVSRAIAKACGADFESILVVEAYLDKAPKEILHTLEELKQTLIETVDIQASGYDEEQKELLRNCYRNWSLSEMVCNTSQTSDTNVPQPTQTKTLVVTDNSMLPVLSKGSQLNVIPLNQYQNGNILCFYEKNNPESIIIRECHFLHEENDYILTLPKNTSEYETKVYKADEIAIIGKVHSAFVNL